MVRVNPLLCIGACLCDAVVLRDARSQTEAHLSSVASAEVSSTLEALSDAVLDPAGSDADIGLAVKAVSGKMDLKSASNIVNHDRLPKDVSSLVQTVADGDSAADPTFTAFDEASLDKARVALNDLVEKAWLELDDKIFKCKGFQDMNRNNYEQVTRDIMRLIEQINDLERLEAEAIEGINQKEQEILDVEALLEKETKLYNVEYSENKAELTIRQNDLDVFQFILEFTATPCGGALEKLAFAQVCEMNSGRKTLLFHDKAAAGRYKKLLNPRTKRSIDQLLTGLVQQPSKGVTTSLPPQKKEPVVGEDGMACVGAVGQVAGQAGEGSETGGEGTGDEDECMKSCGPDLPDPCLLHDKLSLMWGEYKDQVDELTMIMMHNYIVFVELKTTLNAQIRMLVAAKARFQQLLAEARANLAADRAELKEKYKQKAQLNRQYYNYMMKCKKRIQWIMYQDMCAIKVVRNAVLENSTECAPEMIQDCDLDAWVKGTCRVSKTHDSVGESSDRLACDDSCDPAQPFKCGGWAEMTRNVVAEPNKCGMKCPMTKKFIRCGQYKCPVDCHMSSWSGWSKCTAECEGGLQSHTREILVKPMNGGEQCNTVEESRPCNTMSCDRNCRLQRWTQWSPCSVACGGGFQESFRHVLIPTRGEGKCPRDKSRYRYRKRRCNLHDCNGDEICIAKQDLIMAIDGSGSVREKGFKVLQDYATALLERYQMQYFGEPAMRIGIVLFGNGKILTDGRTVAPAINVQKLTGTLQEVKDAVAKLKPGKGFTNMAQAFSLAEDMFIKGSRKDAQQSVMTITDGKPSFAFMTNEMVEQLDDKGIMRYFVVVNSMGPNSDVMKQMKMWASQPWETNLIHVQGSLMLEADTNLWVEKALTKFCPLAYSPSMAVAEAEVYGFDHVKDSGWCGEKKDENILSKTASDAEACAALAIGAKKTSFMLGNFFRRGWCIAGTMDVSSDQYKEWQGDKIDPKCKEDGSWKSSMLYDFYACEPAVKAAPAPAR